MQILMTAEDMQISRAAEARTPINRLMRRAEKMEGSNHVPGYADNARYSICLWAGHEQHSRAIY